MPSPTPPPGGYTTMTAPKFFLGGPSEFVYDDAVPVALRMRFGTQWVGSRNIGETLKVSMKRLGTAEEITNGNAGQLRGILWKGLGWEVQLEIQHDREFPFLDFGHRVSLWVLDAADDDGNAIPVKRHFHVMERSEDYGDEETAMYKVTVTHKAEWSEITTLVRAKIDEAGLVREYTTDSAVTVAAPATAPGSVLPTAPA